MQTEIDTPTSATLLAPEPPTTACPVSWRRESTVAAMVFLTFPVIALVGPGDADSATRRAFRLIEFERSLGIDQQPRLASWTERLTLLDVAADVVYYGAHVPVLIGTAVVLAVRRPDVYRSWRTGFLAAHAMTVLGYLLVPTAPPRLLPTYGTDPARAPADAVSSLPADSVWGSVQYEYAAMPSGHVAFAAFVALAAHRAGSGWWRRAGVVYLPVIVVVTLVTDNHHVADIVVALLLVAIADRSGRLLNAART